jgi:hypothetical protein
MTVNLKNKFGLICRNIKLDRKCPFLSMCLYIKHTIQKREFFLQIKLLKNCSDMVKYEVCKPSATQTVSATSRVWNIIHT